MVARICLQDGRFVNLDAAVEVDPQPTGELYLIMPAPSFIEPQAPHVTIIDHPDDVALAMAYYHRCAAALKHSLRPHSPVRGVPPDGDTFDI